MLHPNLNEDEMLTKTFVASKATYIKEHVMLAAIGSVIATAVLMFMGDPNPWVGIVAAIMAIGIRGFYLASEQLNLHWHLTDRRLILPDGSALALRDIAKTRTILSAAQVVATTGDKYMMKYMADPAAICADIDHQRKA
ncbi:hypothetical protein [Cochlodiniinecator piscidefendens]|uniref:hypothetical protein n=1 Tax=Cochlodiniinecator piscidefendens TaxID=2715756 RepID=UPI00140E7D97|nr:hypothetical protein [Cochlodiniinecator piscidefendens]